jgi:hypothetical protein
VRSPARPSAATRSKEGLAHAERDYTPTPGDALSYRALDAFFGVVHFLVDAGVTLVVEASFQHALWEPGLRPVLRSARVRIVHCRVDAAVAWERITRRADETAARRAVHGDYRLLEPFERFKKTFNSFNPIALTVPSLEVDTTDGYDPAVDEIVAFLNRP